MKKLFLTLALTTNTLSLLSMDPKTRNHELSVVSSAPSLTGPLAIAARNCKSQTTTPNGTPVGSPNLVLSRRSSRASITPLTLPVSPDPKKVTTGFTIAPLTPPSSTATSPQSARTPTVEAQPLATPNAELHKIPATPMSAKKWSERTANRFELAVQAYNQQQQAAVKKRLPLASEEDRSKSQSVIRYSWMSSQEEQAALRRLKGTIGEQL